MIQVYKPGTSLSRNGDMVLTPSECTVTAKLNEVWTLEMVHPIDPEGRWEYIVEEGVLKVPTWQDSDQLYRISSIEKTEDSVSVVAYPIFLDTRNRVFIDNLTVRGTAQTALNQMLALGPTDPDNPGTALFKASAYVSPVRALNFSMRNFMDCLNGNDEPTIIGMYGGEFEYDNFRIYLRDQIGTDNDVYVRYGKNITGIEYTVDYSEMITRIYPVAYGDYTISGTKYVDSTRIGSYDMIYAKMVVFDNIRMITDVREDETDNYIICNNQTEMNTQLRSAAAKMMADGADVPKVSIKIDMVSLADSDQYADISNFETIRLGDTVHCVHERLGVVSDTRAVGITWDCAKNRIKAIELGEFSFDYMRDIASKVDAIANITNPDGSIMAERVRGFLDGTKTAIHILRTSATTAHVMAVLFEDKVSGSPTYGALGIGTKGLMVAKEWDDNLNDWAWETAITADGVLSPMIVTNTISGASAQNWWDLQLGQISFQTISNDVNDRDTAIKNALEQKIDNLDTTMTSLEICQEIFDDGRIKGFKTRTNPSTGETEFYLSFDAMIGGELGLGGENNGNGYLIVKDSNDWTSFLADCHGNVMGARDSSTGTYTYLRHIRHRFEIYNVSPYKAKAIFDWKNDPNDYTASVLENTFGMTKFGYIDVMGIPDAAPGGTGEMAGIVLHAPANYQEGIRTRFYWSTNSALLLEYGYISGEARTAFNATFDSFHVVGYYDKATKFHIYKYGTNYYQADLQVDYFRFGLSSSSSDAVFAGYRDYNTGQPRFDCYCEAYGFSSDRRLKTNVKPADSLLETINALNVVEFDWKKSGTHVVAGFIAQDAQGITPSLVDYSEKQDVYTFNYIMLVPMLTKAVQELSAKCDDQQSRINSLESKLSNACDRITRLENLVSSLMEGK